MSYKEKQGKELDVEAKKLGLPIDDVRQTREGHSSAADAKIQERVRDAKNARYAKLAWIIALASAIIALASAIASVVSAIAAWSAVLK